MKIIKVVPPDLVLPGISWHYSSGCWQTRLLLSVLVGRNKLESFLKPVLASLSLFRGLRWTGFIYLSEVDLLAYGYKLGMLWSSFQKTLSGPPHRGIYSPNNSNEWLINQETKGQTTELINTCNLRIIFVGIPTWIPASFPTAYWKLYFNELQLKCLFFNDWKSATLAKIWVSCTWKSYWFLQMMPKVCHNFFYF